MYLPIKWEQLLWGLLELGRLVAGGEFLDWLDLGIMLGGGLAWAEGIESIEIEFKTAFILDWELVFWLSFAWLLIVICSLEALSIFLIVSSYPWLRFLDIDQISSSLR